MQWWFFTWLYSNCTSKRIYMYKYIYVHTYIHACMHACIHTYIHTYMYYIYVCIKLWEKTWNVPLRGCHDAYICWGEENFVSTVWVGSARGWGPACMEEVPWEMVFFLVDLFQRYSLDLLFFAFERNIVKIHKIWRFLLGHTETHFCDCGFTDRFYLGSWSKKVGPALCLLRTPTALPLKPGSLHSVRSTW